MDIQKSKELSFDTQDFPKEVWVFDADNLDQGTEISHLMMSHAEEYTKDELLVICRQASMVIDQLRTDLAKAQAVPEGFVLVPKEPTQKMLDATINLAIPAVYVDSISGQHKLKVAAYYKAMLAASQEPAND